MERPVDAVTSSILRLQIAQRAVNTYVEELIQRVAADPDHNTSLPGMRVRLSELRSDVDDAAANLIDAIARMGDGNPPELS